MRSHSRVANMQPLGHSPVVDALDHEPQDLCFPGGQARQQLLSHRALAGDSATFRKGGGDHAGRYNGLACCSRTYRLDDLLAARRLELITSRTSLDRFAQPRIAIGPAEEDDSRSAASSAHLPP